MYTAPLTEPYLPMEDMIMLLSKFVDPGKLIPEAVEMSYNYLFKAGTPIPFFKDEDLHETVQYLKDVMDQNDLATLADILNYYKKKKDLVVAYMKTIKLPPSGSAARYNFDEIKIKPWNKPGALTPRTCCVMWPDEVVSRRQNNALPSIQWNKPDVSGDPVDKCAVEKPPAFVEMIDDQQVS